MSESPTPSGPSVTGLLFDACIYVPLGFVLEAPSLLPKLAERGRNQVRVAQMIGKFAVARLGGDLGCMREDAEKFVGAALSMFGITSGSPPATKSAFRSEATTTAPAADPIDVVGGEPEAHPAAAASLPLAGYDTLAASHVVPRLATMTRAELEAVGAYERANRARRTIINRVEQLLQPEHGT